MSLFLTSSRARTVAALGALALYAAVYAMAWPSAPLLSARDSLEYLDYAARLTTNGFREPHYRLPGYPLILALFGGADAAQNRYLFYFQLLTHAAGIALLAAVLKRLGAARKLRATFVALMILPPFVETAAFVLTESFSGFLLASLLYCLVRWLLDRSTMHASLAALLAALVFLVRPAYLLLGPVLAAILYLTRRGHLSLRSALGFAVPSILTCALLVGINYSAFSYAGLTPKAGFMLFTRTLTFLERIPDSRSDVREILIRNRDSSLTLRGSSHSATHFMWEGGLDELLAKSQKPKIELSQDMLRLNLHLIASAPLNYAVVVGRSMAESWFPSATQVSFFGNHYVQLAWALLHFCLVGLYFLALAFGLARGGLFLANRSDLLASPSLHPCTGLVEILLHTTIWYTCLVSAAVEVGDPRYLRPVLPAAAVVTVLFLVRWNDLRNSVAATGSPKVNE